MFGWACIRQETWSSTGFANPTCEACSSCDTLYENLIGNCVTDANTQCEARACDTSDCNDIGVASGTYDQSVKRGGCVCTSCEDGFAPEFFCERSKSKKIKHQIGFDAEFNTLT